MKYFVTLKSATCHHPCLPIHPSVYIPTNIITFTHTPINNTHEHHYVHFLKGSGRKKPKKSAKILTLGTACVFEQFQPWVSLAWTGWPGPISFPHSPAVYLRGIPHMYPHAAWQQLFHPSFYNLWEHQAKTTDCSQTRMIGNTLSAGWKENCTKTQRFFYASHWGPHHHWPLD